MDGRMHSLDDTCDSLRQSSIKGVHAVQVDAEMSPRVVPVVQALDGAGAQSCPNRTFLFLAKLGILSGIARSIT